MKKILKEHISLEENFRFGEIVKKDDYKYPDNYYKDLNEINLIIEDNKLIIFYPILSKGNRKIPLICFEMKINDRNLVINSYRIQIDAMRLIFSLILNCELAEVELLVNDYESFFESISNLEQESIFKIVKMIEVEIANKFNIKDFSLWDNRDYDNWAMTREIILTLESCSEFLFPPYQKEIEEVKYYLKKDSSLLLNKYLLTNKKGISSNKIVLNGHLGSYTEKFPINYKQMNVLSAYQNIDLLAVNGPPGTGKTTVIKEIIANNIVKKAKLFIDNWDISWIRIGNENRQVNMSPLNGLCQYSMVIASGNNKAVDNIGKELLQEISYFSDVVSSEDNIKGLLCAQLGKYDNLNNFRERMLNPLIDYLININNCNEMDINTYKEKYLQLYNEINDLNSRISNYLLSRDLVCNDLMNTDLFDEEISEDTVNNIYAIQKEFVCSLETEINPCRDKLETLKDKKTRKENKRKQYQQMIDSYDDEIKKNYTLIDKINLASHSFLFFKIKVKKLEKQVDTKENLIINIKELQNSKKSFHEAYDQLEREIKIIENQKNLMNKNINIKSDDLKHVKKNIEKLDKFKSLIEEYNGLVEEFGINANWNSKRYSFFSHNSLVKKRHELFELSLKVMECYIKKYAHEIVYNLKKVFPAKWFQPFFRANFRYDEEYISCLKAVWETLFLCFPVVTTTLYALDLKKISND